MLPKTESRDWNQYKHETVYLSRNKNVYLKGQKSNGQTNSEKYGSSNLVCVLLCVTQQAVTHLGKMG